MNVSPLPSTLKAGNGVIKDTEDNPFAFVFGYFVSKFHGFSARSAKFQLSLPTARGTLARHGSLVRYAVCHFRFYGRTHSDCRMATKCKCMCLARRSCRICKLHNEIAN